MGINRRPHENALRDARNEAERRRIEDATSVVAAWNERVAQGRPAFQVPTIGAALLAKHKWLSAYCSGCDVISWVDLEMVPRDPETPISTVTIKLRCRRCRGGGPKPVFRKLAKRPD